MSKVVILDNVRSAQNVGAIFRTAEGAGVNVLYLVGYTPTPVDRFGREQPAIKKTALGATQHVAWHHCPDAAVSALVAALKAEGYTIIAVEQTTTAVSLYDFAVPERVAYIFGNEITGVSPAFLAVADGVVEIPMAGKKESLNVSVSAGVMLFYR